MKRLGIAVLSAVLVAGCSSSGAHRASPVRADGCPVGVPPPAPRAAVTLAHRLLDDAILPPGAKPYSGPVPRRLTCDPAGTLGLVNRVQAHRLWTMRSTAPSVAGFLQTYRPRGFTGRGEGSAGTVRSKTEWTYYTENQLTVLPVDISNAELDISVSDAGAGNVVIRVDSIVAWTQPRPQAEFASAQDRVVILTVIHLDKSRRGKRVVATKASVVRPLVWSFNQLRLSASRDWYECPPGGRLNYQVAFARSPAAPPDVVATMGLCTGIEATAGKHVLPALDQSAAFVAAVAHLLGASELHY